MATSQDFVNWVCSDELDPQFLKYLFMAEGDGLLRFASGAVHQTIYFPEVKAFHICLPPMGEQKRVVAFVDQELEAISTVKANADKNLLSGKRIFESYREGILSSRIDDWLEAPLGTICDIKHGYAFEGEFFASEGDYALLTPGNVYETGGYRNRGDKQKYFTGQIPDGFILKEGDLLVAMTEQAAGLLGSPILVPTSNRFLHNQRLGLVVAKPNIPWHNGFFFHVFNTRRVRDEIHRSAAGLKVRHTSPKKIGDVRVYFPKSVDEQKRISESLSAVERECRRLAGIYTAKGVASDSLKASVLHYAFSGKLAA